MAIASVKQLKDKMRRVIYDLRRRDEFMSVSVPLDWFMGITTKTVNQVNRFMKGGLTQTEAIRQTIATLPGVSARWKQKGKFTDTSELQGKELEEAMTALNVTKKLRAEASRAGVKEKFGSMVSNLRIFRDPGAIFRKDLKKSYQNYLGGYRTASTTMAERGINNIIKALGHYGFDKVLIDKIESALRIMTPKQLSDFMRDNELSDEFFGYEEKVLVTNVLRDVRGKWLPALNKYAKKKITISDDEYNRMVSRMLLG